MKNFDYSLLRTRTFDREVINYIGLIHEFKGRQQLYLEQKPQELETLVEIAKIQSTESSNAIEGIATTKARLKSLMADKTTPRDRGEKEIKGYRHVLNVIHENFDYVPIRKNYILQLHKMLYQFTEERFGGSFKDTPNEIDMVYPDGRAVLLFKPLEPFETPYAVERICEEYDKAINTYGIDPLIAIPVFILDFLCIHPFNDGNGRMSRLLTTLLLYKSDFVIGRYISLEKKIEMTKDEYYIALQESSQNWYEEKNDDTPFIKYILGIILAAYRDFEERVELVSEKLPAKEMVRRAIYSKMGKLSKSDISELCPSIGVKSVELALKQLVDEGVLEKKGLGRATFYIRKDINL